MSHLLARIPAWEVAAALVALMALSWQLGQWIGARQRLKGGNLEIGKFADVTLTLLSLLISFTFSLSLSKHYQRRELVVDESNTIADFYTSGSFVSEPVRSPLLATVREYLELRIDMARHPEYDPLLTEERSKAQVLHERMTALVNQAVQDRTPVVVPLVNDLNKLTSANAARLAAFRDRLPASIVILLFFASILAIGMAGRTQGRKGNVDRIGIAGFILLVSLTVWVTLDLNQPRRGIISVSNEPLEHLLTTMSPK